MKFTGSLTAVLAFLGLAVQAQAAVPQGYYDKCENKSDQGLLSALCSTIGSHTKVSYDGLWNVYKQSDVRDDGTLWDIYTTKHWPANFTKCGNYKVIGDCVNREHSFPKSWWGGGSQTQYSDAFHLYPTDGKVNGQRSNFPYGECANGKSEASQGSVRALGRLGNSTFPGYSGTVFEPDDEYKGDLARSYFYMAACYNGAIAGWTQGNGKEMLAGNNYPVFKTWAINLLLKWHRQDPVSKKEQDRNEAIYGFQHNRNPFIDHPELAEYIWGDKKGQAWTASGSVEPAFSLPVDGSVIDLGQTVAGFGRTATVRVKGVNLSENVSLSVAGDGFSVSPATLGKTACMTVDGAAATVTFNPSASSATECTGTLTVRCGSLSTTVNLRGTRSVTVPAGPVRGIDADSFTAVWTYVGDADAQGCYTLDVKREVVSASASPHAPAAVSISGYPRAVKATDEYFTVTDLDPSTTYTYIVATRTLTSAPVTVSTTAPVPAVNFLYDDEPTLYALADEPSAAAEILMEAEYIDGDITLAVQAPFQISTDKADWRTAMTVSPELDRFYLRIYSAVPGDFFTSIVATAPGGFYNDDADFNAVVSVPGATFHEDFEAGDTGTDYGKPGVQGTMSYWSLSNVAVVKGEGRSGNGVRMGKNSNSTLTMDEDHVGGLGVVTVWTKGWSDKEGGTYCLEYSTDAGRTWQSAGSAEVPASWEQQTFTVNTTQPVRLRVRQTAGGRFNLDDIEATQYSAVAEIETEDYHLWDAYCRDSRIVIEASVPGRVARVYALDGTEVFHGTVNSTVYVDVPAGLYIVAVDDYGRRVLVK